MRALAVALALLLGAFRAPAAEAAPQMVVQLGHTYGVTAVALTPDGRFALSAGQETLLLWDLATGAELRSYKLPYPDIWSMALSPDGAAVACANHHGQVWLMDVAEGRLLRTFAGHQGPVNSLAFSQDGRVLATGGDDATVRLWTVATGAALQTFQGRGPVRAVAVSPDGRWLAAGIGTRLEELAGHPVLVRLWSLPDGIERAALEGHQIEVKALAFAPDSARLASAGMDRTVRLWDLATLQPGPVFSQPRSQVNAVAFSPDGRRLASVEGAWPEEDYRGRLWDLASGRQEREFPGGRNGMQCLAFSRDGKTLATGRRLGLQLWDPERGSALKTLQGHASHVTSVRFSPDGRRLATGQSDGTARIWDLGQGVESRVLKGHGASVASIALNADGQRLATTSYDKTIRLWGFPGGEPQAVLQGGGEALGQAVFTPDGRALLASAGVGLIRRWKSSGAPDGELKAGGLTATDLAVSPDGRYLATVLEKDVSIWGARRGDRIHQLTHPADVVRVAYSPDGTQLLAGCEDHLAYLWDLRQEKVARTFRLDDTVGSVAFSRDGTRIALGGWDGAVAVYDPATGRQVAAGVQGAGGINAVAFSPDGRRLATAGGDGAAHLWAADTLRELARLFSLDQGWVVVTPGGQFDGSPDGLKAIQWTVGLQAFPLEAFSEGYYTPALLPRVLSGQESAAADVAKGFSLPPLVRITAPAPGAQLEAGTLEVRVEATDQGGGIDEIRLYLNGKAVGKGGRGVKVAAGPGRAEVFQVALADGENQLRAVALSTARIESNPSTLTVNLRGPERTASLHVLAVGIDHYKNPAMDLNFARADAGAVAGFFTGAPGRLFKEVRATPLYDAAATKSAILGALAALRALPPQDVAVIYLAGHGEVIGNIWYFLPFEVVYPEREDEVRAKGLSSGELQEAIRAVGAQKVLVLLDACKSGEAMAAFAGRGVEDRKALATLARATGVHIVAASTKDQVASEVAALGHGVFTYTLLQGLGGEAGAGGAVTVRRLLAFVEERLPELSQKYRAEAQYPVVDSRGMDFPLAAGKQSP